jgi:hypothetical protein
MDRGLAIADGMATPCLLLSFVRRESFVDGRGNFFQGVFIKLRPSSRELNIPYPLCG